MEMIWYNYLAGLSHDSLPKYQACPPPITTYHEVYESVSSGRSEAQVVYFIGEKNNNFHLYRYFRAGLPGSTDFVLLNTWDANGALFANVLYDIPIFHVNSIHNLDGNMARDFQPRGHQISNGFVLPTRAVHETGPISWWTAVWMRTQRSISAE